MTSERQINSLSGLLAVKMIRQQISLTNRLTHQSTTLINKQRQWRTRAEHRRLKSGPQHMRGTNIHKNIPVPVTKLTLGLVPVRSHVTADKLFPVNPRTITGPLKMSLLLVAKSMSALGIKARFILVMHTDVLGWYIMSNQQGQMFIQKLNRIVSKPNVTPGQIPHCTTDSIPIDLMFQKNFPTHTQVWNHMSHQNDCRQRGVIWVTYRCFNKTHTRSGTSVIRRSSVPPRASVRPTTNWLQPWTV